MPTKLVVVRISPTIANEYATRNPEYIPAALHSPGKHRVTRKEAKTLLDDAEFNSNRKVFDIGPNDMPLPVFNAYVALAKQLRKVLAE